MQNNQRIFLIIALGLISFLIYSKWTEVNRPSPLPETEEVARNSIDPDSPLAQSDSGVNTLPIASNNGVGETLPSLSSSADKSSPEQYVTVKTDVYDIKIALNGGDIFDVGLIKHPVSLDEPDTPYQLMEASKNRFIVNETGLIGVGELNNYTPRHDNTFFSTDKTAYIMKDGADELIVPLTFVNSETGYSVEKRYIFQRGKYSIGFEQTLENNRDVAWEGIQYLRFKNNQIEGGRGIGASSYSGTVYSLPKTLQDKKLTKYEKVKYANMGGAKNSAEGIGGWISFIEQYFVIALIPGENLEANKATKNVVETYHLKDDGKYLTQVYDRDAVKIKPGERHTFKSQFYVGPKLKDQLHETAENLDLTLDFGWFSFISNIMLWVLKLFHGFVGNWGWSIILLTVTTKIALLYFANKGYVSMARMRHVGPKLQLIRERYADDKQKLSEEMMKLYRKEKINPLGGCWPIIIQIPIFISLFWMLMESVELRQAPWIFWIQDLSQRDPYFILPILMGVTMFFQQRLNPAPPDPTQAMIIKWMPLVFTFMFMWFASGIVLYWVTNNLLTILQQSIIMRRIEKADGK